MTSNNHFLSAAPSWYCSRVCEATDDGIVVFAAKNSIFWNDVNLEYKYLGHLTAHLSRVVGLSLCFNREIGDPIKISTTSEDGRVKVWNLGTKTLITEHTAHPNQPTTIHWSPVDSSIIVSGDDRGNLVIWKHEHGHTEKLKTESASISALTCSPHHANLVAVGFKTGILTVVDISKQGSVLYRLRGHDEDIQGLVWCPLPSTDDIQECTDAESKLRDYSYGGSLASSSKDRTIRIWNTTTQNARVIKVPNNPGSGRKDRFDDQSRVRVWIALHWPKSKPDTMLASCHNGEIISLDLKVTGKSDWALLMPTKNCRAHNRIVFNITTCTVGERNFVCSASMDRQLNIWDLDTLTGLQSIPTLGGFCYCLQESPIYAGQLAVGCGDSIIRIWNTTNPLDPYNVVNIWQGIKAKVTTLSWHPTEEGILAYGTDDGRVGIQNILTPNRGSIISSTYHKRTVYVVTWGPQVYSKDCSSVPDDSYCIYSCGDGNILMHDRRNMNKRATDVNTVIKQANGNEMKLEQHSDIKWKPDSSVVAVGNEDGSVEIYKSPHLELMCRTSVNRKIINCISWHPEFISDERSNCHAWLAMGSNDTTIHVIDLQKVISSWQSGCDVVQISDSFIQLEGHGYRVVGLSWSTHRDGQLVSASYDLSAQVWNVLDGGKAVANYRGHSGRLHCVQWCGTDPDVIYSGSEDNSMLKWKISEQIETIPPKDWKKKSKTKDRFTTKKNISQKHSHPVNGNSSIEDTSNTSAQLNTSVEELDSLKQMLAAKQQELKTTPSPTTNIHTENKGEEAEFVPHTVAREIAYKKETREKRKKKHKSLFPSMSNQENHGSEVIQQDCVKLAKYLNSDKTSLPDDQAYLGLFGNRRNLYQMMDMEKAYHGEHDNFEQQCMLELWKGDLGEMLQNAADKKQLNDWLVSLAPQVSHKTYIRMCQLYAKQLENDGLHHRAVSYLLSINDVYGAIQLLQAHGMYRDSLCLAKARLPHEDPVITEIIQQWSKQLTTDYAYEQAAKCLLTLSEPVEAAKLFTRRGHLSSLYNAVQLLLASNCLEQAQQFCVRAAHDAMLRFDWTMVNKTVRLHPSFQHIGLLSNVHEVLCKELSRMNLFEIQTDDETKLANQTNCDGKAAATPKSPESPKTPKFLIDLGNPDPLSIWSQHPPLIDGSAVVHHIIGTWISMWQLSEATLLEMAEKLIVMTESRQAKAGTKQILQQVSLEITIGIVQLLLKSADRTAHWWVMAFETCFHAQQFHILTGLLRILLPLGPPYLTSLQTEVAVIMDLICPDLSKKNICALKPSFEKTESLETFHLFNTNNYYCTLDCLKAMYYYTELYCAMNNVHELDKSDNNKEEAVCSINAQNSTFNLDQVRRICPYILCELCVKENEISSSLEHIRKAVSRLVKTHTESNKPADDDDDDDVLIPQDSTIKQDLIIFNPQSIRESRLSLLQSSTILRDRSLSGEYLLMRPVRKLQNTDPSTIDETEEYEEMKSPLYPELDENRYVYDDVFESWYKLPVDKKYADSSVTLAILSSEQKRMEEELHTHMLALQPCPFPDPLESAQLLMKVLATLSDVGANGVAQEIGNWAVQKAYLSSQIDSFQTLLNTLESS